MTDLQTTNDDNGLTLKERGCCIMVAALWMVDVAGWRREFQRTPRSERCVDCPCNSSGFGEEVLPSKEG